MSEHPQSAGEYVVIARRYRPQRFEDLVGQEHVARALQQAITSERVGHAYLFTGARGVGKTSAARILAKALNCVTGPTPTPCNECDVCRCVSTGDDVDVIEIDGASNRGIDEMRQLRQNVAVRPSRVRFKIYIIDEVHMLTKEAFNALLKTLEEPPEHVKFIFATTEPHKIPITILSRCQRFDFAGIRAGQIQARLMQIAAAEGVDVEPAAVQILASRAAGSMRDSQSLLEQLLAVADGRITANDVTQLLGIAPAERLTGLVRQLVDNNAAAALAELEAAIDGGVEVGQLLDQLVGYFRDVMTAAVGCSAEQMLYALPSQADDVVEIGRRLGLSTVLAIVQILDQTAARMRMSMHGRTLVEMAVVRICNLENLEDLASLIAELRGEVADDSSSPAAVAPRPMQATSPPAPAKKNDEAVISTSLGNIPTPPQARPQPVVPPPIVMPAVSVETPPVAVQVPEATPIAFAAPTIEIEAALPPQPIGELTVETDDTQAEVAATNGDVVPQGSVLSKFQEALTATTPASNTNNANGANGNAAPHRSQRESRREQMAEIAERPFVKRALELFDVPPGQFRFAPAGGDSPEKQTG